LNSSKSPTYLVEEESKLKAEKALENTTKSGFAFSFNAWDPSDDANPGSGSNRNIYYDQDFNTLFERFRVATMYLQYENDIPGVHYTTTTTDNSSGSPVVITVTDNDYMFFADGSARPYETPTVDLDRMWTALGRDSFSAKLAHEKRLYAALGFQETLATPVGTLSGGASDAYISEFFETIRVDYARYLATRSTNTVNFNTTGSGTSRTNDCWEIIKEWRDLKTIATEADRLYIMEVITQALN